MNAKEIEKLKETVSTTGSAIYGSDTEEYKILNELSDEEMENFTEWLIGIDYELRYRNDEDIFIIC